MEPVDRSRSARAHRILRSVVGVGAWYTWEGNDDLGKGKLTITSASAEEVTYDLEFIEPFPSTADVGIALDEQGDGTKVTWWMEGRNDFMGKLFDLFVGMDSVIGADFERGLEKLEHAETAGG